MYHPLVQEVLSVIELDDNGNLALAVGNDPPAILMESIAAYKRGVAMTRADDIKLRAEQLKREREALG